VQASDGEGRGAGFEQQQQEQQQEKEQQQKEQQQVKEQEEAAAPIVFAPMDATLAPTTRLRDPGEPATAAQPDAGDVRGSGGGSGAAAAAVEAAAGSLQFPPMDPGVALPPPVELQQQQDPQQQQQQLLLQQQQGLQAGIQPLQGGALLLDDARIQGVYERLPQLPVDAPPLPPIQAPDIKRVGPARCFGSLRAAGACAGCRLVGWPGDACFARATDDRGLVHP
jgi:hypothetical protein